MWVSTTLPFLETGDYLSSSVGGSEGTRVGDMCVHSRVHSLRVNSYMCLFLKWLIRRSSILSTHA